MIGERPTVAREQTWPYIVACRLKSKMVNLAKEQALSEDALERLPIVLASGPSRYFLQLGQWSQNHEEPQPFMANLKRLIETLSMARIPIWLVSPPHQFARIGDFWEYFDILRTLGALYRGATFVDVTGVNEMDDFESGSVLCHYSVKGAMKVADIVYAHC